MPNKSIKAALDEQLAGIAVSPQLEKRIMALPKAVPTTWRRSMVILLACGALLIVLPVLAVTSPSFQKLIAMVSEPIAEMLQPLELVSESNGIRMEVVAAMSDERSAVAYFTLKDMTGEQRLKGLIAPIDCGIEGAYNLNPRSATYDEEMQTVMLSALGYGEGSLYGQEVTFSLRSFLVGRTEYDDVAIDIPLEAFQHEEEAVWLDKNIIAGYSYHDIDEITGDDGIKILPPNQMYIPIPGVDFAYISNIGLIDGRLHVQTSFPKKKYTPFQPDEMDEHMDDHGETWLLGTDGQAAEREYSTLSVSFAVDEQGELCSSGYSMNDLYAPPGDKVHYREEVFTVKPDMAQFSLRGSFVTNEAFITGDWSVTFQLQAVNACKKADCDIDLGMARIHTVVVSAMGLSIIGEKEDPHADVQATVLLNMKDGSHQTFEDITTIMDGTHFEFHSISKEPLDIELIQGVSINGQEVLLIEKQ